MLTNRGFQLIELWETFLLQLDADEDGEPFFKPQLPTSPQKSPHSNTEGDQQERNSDQVAVTDTAIASGK